ncbi:protein of unknown function [Hyphomicrobium sp. MC1]|nr:protein of unknown function [Hyphomicrobium sp. MC1]
MTSGSVVGLGQVASSAESTIGIEMHATRAAQKIVVFRNIVLSLFNCKLRMVAHWNTPNGPRALKTYDTHPSRVRSEIKYPNPRFAIRFR